MAKDAEKSAKLVPYKVTARGFWNGNLVEPGAVITGPEGLKASWFHPMKAPTSDTPGGTPPPGGTTPPT